jgi:hypothetical protein
MSFLPINLGHDLSHFQFRGIRGAIGFNTPSHPSEVKAKSKRACQPGALPLCDHEDSKFHLLIWCLVVASLSSLDPNMFGIAVGTARTAGGDIFLGSSRECTGKGGRVDGLRMASSLLPLHTIVCPRTSQSRHLQLRAIQCRKRRRN